MSVSWTDDQKKVIALRGRSILVSAAAGSGKTAVLVQRILSKITDQDHPVDIDRMLIMTFTRAAAGEMKERIALALQEELYKDPENTHLQRQMTLVHTAQISTIDGFCAYLVKNYFHRIGLDPAYRVAEEGEMRLFKEEVVSKLLNDAYEEKDPDFLKLVECLTPGKNDDILKDQILELYEKASTDPEPEKWLEGCIAGYHFDEGEKIADKEWGRLLLQDAGENLEE
ncbi:MAG: UvrD-helicase domain-containing protein, partial [Blautia sp.]|nr:UvrD-helicase domain-containing protein [Blautia sp.]